MEELVPECGLRRDKGGLRIFACVVCGWRISPGVSPGAVAQNSCSCWCHHCPVQRFCSAANGFSGLVVHKEIHLNIS